MTADRNHTADALDRIADRDDTDNFITKTCADAARLLRTPNTPADSDTAARARALLHSYQNDQWAYHDFVAAAPTLITDLLAEVDRLSAEGMVAISSEHLTAMSDANAALAVERDAAVAKMRELDERLDACPSQNTLDYYTDALERAYAERDAAVARADALRAGILKLIAGGRAVGTQMVYTSALRDMLTAADRGTDR